MYTLTEKSKFENFEQSYVSGLMCCMTFLKQIFNFNIENENGLRLIKSHTSPVLNKMSLKIESVNLVRILHISVELLKCISLKDVKEQDKLKNLLYKICFLAETQVGNMKWITELRDKLNYLKNSDIHIVSFKDITLKDEQMKHLVSKVSVLEKALSRNDFNAQLVHKFSTYKGNKNLQVVVEMLLLDIMCILEDSNKNLTHNLLFLDEISPVLVGRNLRNHLAHGNALFDILQNEASVAIAINAKKLISENMVLHQKNKIGKVINDDPIKLKNRYEQELNFIDIQNLYFNALLNGNFEDMKKHIKEGADVQAKSLHSWTSLHFASQGGNVKIVAFLLSQKLDVNAKDKNGRTPVHVASVFGHKDIIKELLENGANIGAKDSHFKTPLHLAAKNGHTGVIKLLLKYNASASAKDFVNGTAIHYAIVYNHIGATEILIAKQNIDAVVILNGYTSLHVAADNGHLELVNLFLKLKANVNAQTDDFITPLHLASFNGNLDVVKTLILAEAQINAKTVEGGTPLHCAVENSQKEIAELLLEEGADINAVNGYGLTPLHFAAGMGNLGIVELLVEKKCSINLVTNENMTSLYFAAEKGHPDVVSFLLKQNASLNTKCYKGFSALHIAANNGHNDVVKLLVEGGSIVNDRDVHDRTPLHLATINNNLEVVATLISLGADIDIKDKEGLTALHISCQNGHESIAEHLIVNGANLTTQNKNGDVPMFMAVKSGCLSTTKLLIKNGTDITFVNKSGLTALHVSAFYGNTDILKLFLQPNSDIDVFCELGLSPLHFAVQGNHRKTVNFLLKKGANINAKDLSGHTPLCFAVRNNCIEIVNDLIMFGADTNIGCPLLISIGLNYPDIAQVLIHNEKCDITAPDEIRTSLKPLHMAALRGQRNVIKSLLVRGADINLRSNNQTPLHYAASEGHNDVVNVLLTNKCLMNLQTDEGYTPLFMASMSGHEKVVETLLNGGADPYIADFQNRTCLEMAVANNELKLLEILLRHCIVKINDKDEKGITLLHIAAHKGLLDITELLVANGADINAINARGFKPINEAALSGHKNIVKFYLEKEIEGIEDSSQLPMLHCAALGGNLEIVKYLISNRKMDVNHSNSAGDRPLHVAASLGHCNIISFLLQNGAYLNALNSHNRSALDITKSRGREQATKLLEITEKYFDAVKRNNINETEEYLKEGAVVNVKNNAEVTPLIYASWKGFNNIVTILLNYNADPNITGKSGCTALHHACKFNHINIVKSLLSHKARYNVSCCSGETPVDFTTNKDIKEIFGFINKSFQSVQNKDTSIISELNNLEDKDVVKIVMNAYNRDDKTLILLGVHSGFPKIEQLKKILNDGMSIELKVADDLCYEERYEEALVVFKEVHEKRKHLFGPDNPDTLEMQLMVGKMLFKLQKFEEALEVSEDVCQKQKELLGEENEDTMRTKKLIALLFYTQGRNEDALALYNDFLPKQIKLLGKNHSDVLDARNEFALVLCALGKFEEALEENYDILKIQEKKYGISHPKVLVTQNNIGIILNEQGKHTEALEIFQKVYETRKRLMGSNHSDTLRTSHWIAGITSHTKQNDNLYHEIFEHQRKVLGPDHLDTLTTQHNHANFLFSQGMIKESLKIYLEIIDRLKNILGTNHFRVVDIEKKIAAIQYGKTLAGDTSSDFSLPNCSSDSPIVSESMQHFTGKNSENFQDEAILTPLHQEASEGNEPLLASNSTLSLMKVEEPGTIKQFRDKNAANDPTKFGCSGFLHNPFVPIFKQLLSPETGENFLTIERPQIFMNFPEKDIFGQDKTSPYPLHYAASVGNIDLLQRLLDAGADVMQAPIYGYTPLHIAASKGFTDLVRILIEHVQISANLKLDDFLNVKTRNDETAALHVVSDYETAVVLLSNGAVYNIRNKEGKTPLQVVKNIDIVNLLSTIEEGFSAIEKRSSQALNKALERIFAISTHERAAIHWAKNLEGERFILKLMDKCPNLTYLMRKAALRFYGICN